MVALSAGNPYAGLNYGWTHCMDKPNNPLPLNLNLIIVIQAIKHD